MSVRVRWLFRLILAWCLAALLAAPAPAADNQAISRVRVQGKIAALTFDDGPEPQTLEILKVLKRHDVKATFFLVGNNVKKHPEIVKKIVESGCEVGNHGLTHVILTKLPADKVREEIVKNQEVIKEACGVAPKVFRASNHGHNDEVWKTLRELGMPSIGSAASVLDWDPKTTVEQIVQRANAVPAGGVILMHSWPGKTLEALPKALEGLKAKGFRIVTVSELLAEGAKAADAVKKVDEPLFSQDFSSFKEGDKLPGDWKAFGKFAFKAAEGRLALELDGHGGLNWAVPLKPGQRELRFSCRMRTEGVEIGDANWKDARVALEFHDAAGKRTGGFPPVPHAVGTTDWKDYDLVLDVPDGAASLVVTPANFGKVGKVAFAAFSVKCTGVAK